MGVEQGQNMYKSVSTREAVVDINNYLDIQRLFRKTARQEVRRRRQAHEKSIPPAREMVKELSSLYIRGDKPASDIKPTQSDERKGAENHLIQTFDNLAPEIERIKSASTPEHVTRRDIIKTIARTAFLLPKLSKEQQEHVLGLGNMDRGEIINAVKKIGISAGIALALTPIVDIILGGSIALGASLAFLHIFNTLSAPLIVGGSYALQYGSLLLDAKQNIRLMHDKRYQFTPNVIATSGGYVTKAILPDNQKAHDAFVGLGTLIPALLQEAVLIPLLVTPFGPALVAARNLIATFAINTPLVGISEYLLKRKRK